VKKMIWLLGLTTLVGMLFSFTPALAQDSLATSEISLTTEQTSNPMEFPTTWGRIKDLYRMKDPSERSEIGLKPMGGTYASQQWWRSLSQGQRNELICQTAYNHMISLGGNVNVFSRSSGYNCKTWVQSYVVPRASQYVAVIPASTSWCTWAAGQYVRIEGYGPAGVSIRGAVRGNIVQSHWGNYPHTMIIWSQTGSGVWVIDCNYNLRGGLTIHYISHSNFETISRGCYTVYQVIGG